MRKISKTALAAAAVAPVAAAADAIPATSAKPVKPAPSKRVLNTAPLGTAAAIQAKRSNVAKPPVAKPVADAPKPDATANADATPAVAVLSAPAKPSANITRTAATVARGATHFGGQTDRDTAYLSFFASIVRRVNTPLTLSAIVATGRYPEYAGSRKPHDAGVINRLSHIRVTVTGTDGKPVSVPILTKAADGHSFTLTDAAASLAACSPYLNADA